MLNRIFFPVVLMVFTITAFIFIQNDVDPVITKVKNEIKIQAKHCKAGQKECVIQLNEFKIKISFDENIYYLKPFKVSVMNVSLDKLKLVSAQVDFKMKKMNMGINRFILKNTAIESNKQVWQGKALLPICVTGRADWLSEFEIETEKNKYFISVPILVEKSPN